MSSHTLTKKMVLIDRLFILQKQTLLRDSIYVVLGSFLLAGASQVSFYLPISAVPFTLQGLAVMVIGATLGSKRGAAATALYLIEGLGGLPVFAGGASGLGVLTGMTFGYLLGFVAAAYWVGRLAEKGKERTFASALPSFLQGYAILFAMGVTWLSFYIGLPKAFYSGFVVFIPFDVLKLVLLSLFFPTLWKVTRKI